MRKRSGFKLVTALLLSGLLVLYGAGAALADAGAPAATDNQQQQSLTIQQAITMAMASSNSLHAASSAVDQANNNLATTQQQNVPELQFTPTGSTTADVEQASNSLTQADLALAYQQSEYQASQDAVVYSVYQDYFNILQDEAALAAAQQALNLAVLQQRATVMNNQLGGASQYQVQQANQADVADEAALSQAEANLTTAYQQFDQLVGLTPDDQPVLTDQPSFAPLVVGSLDAEVSRVLADSPTVLNAQDAVVADKDGLNMVSYVTSENYSSADILNEDENSLANTENSVAQSERNMYGTIQTLESQQNSMQQDLATEQTNLQEIQVGYSIGNNDSLDLATAQSTLATAQQNLLNNNCQHQLDVMLFETPWASSGGSGSSGS